MNPNIILPNKNNNCFYVNDNFLDFALFLLIFEKLNEEKRLYLLSKEEKKNLRKIIFHFVEKVNIFFPGIRGREMSVTTISSPSFGELISSKKKVLSYFRNLQSTFPVERISFIGLAEEYKCHTPCHWKDSTDRKDLQDHDYSFCCHKDELHLCEKDWHWPFIHGSELDLSSWQGRVYTKNIVPDQETNPEDQYHDLDLELSYLLKTVPSIVKKGNRWWWKKKGLNPEKPLTVFDWELDELKRKQRKISNSSYYQNRKKKLLSKKTSFETEINTLTRKLNRLQKKKKNAWRDKDLTEHFNRKILVIKQQLSEKKLQKIFHYD